MRGKRRKDIKKYVETTFPMLPWFNGYQQRADGVIMLARMSQRAIFQNIKRNYTKRGTMA